jgi:hypothetical protein
MTDCTQKNVDGTYKWYCANAVGCKCTGKSTFCGGPGSVIDLSSSINSANGDFTFSCANATKCNAACTTIFQSQYPLVNLTGFGFFYFIFIVSFLNTLFPNGLNLPTCTTGECGLSSDNPNIVSVTTSATMPASTVAGIVVIVILILAVLICKFQSLLCSFYSFAFSF